MSRLARLPQVMLAPNGARRTKDDHPALPVTIAETVAAAKAAFEEGAGALHGHVRDTEGHHSLDAGLYRELIAEMRAAVPGMPVQITTEAAGVFDPEMQRDVVREVMPEGVSVALREMWRGPGDDPEARSFHAWAREAGIAIQHILYTPEDARRLLELVRKGHLPQGVQCLFVLGSYAPARPGSPADLAPFLDALEPVRSALDWAACAFGRSETACLVAAARSGGKARVGFENNLHAADGTLAADNAARVREVANALAASSADRQGVAPRADEPGR